MNYPIFFNAKSSQNLFELQENFRFISELYSKKKLPKILMFSGIKGSGKSTLVNHFLYSIFDEKNYNISNYSFSGNSIFFNQFQNNTFSNIIYISGADFKSVKIEDIRNLKTRILQSTISNKDRFIVFDDVELFNHNSLNALLKIIEEPSKKNYFFLIYNKSKPLIETINSRALEVKIILNETQRLKIIEKLVKFFKIEVILDPKSSQLSPGSFVKFNHICNEYSILPTNDFIKNITLLLNLYKKNKDPVFTNIILFLTNDYFNKLKYDNSFTTNKIIEYKIFVFENINKFFLYNLNPNALLNVIDNKINND